LRDNSHFSEAADGAGGSSTLSLLESQPTCHYRHRHRYAGLVTAYQQLPVRCWHGVQHHAAIGSLLRILGEALEFTHDAANLLPTSNVGMSVLPPKLFRARRSANDRRPL
jgi:hypothetical protein